MSEISLAVADYPLKYVSIWNDKKQVGLHSKKLSPVLEHINTVSYITHRKLLTFDGGLLEPVRRHYEEQVQWMRIYLDTL